MSVRTGWPRRVKGGGTRTAAVWSWSAILFWLRATPICAGMRTMCSRALSRMHARMIGMGGDRGSVRHFEAMQATVENLSSQLRVPPTTQLAVASPPY